MGASGPGIRSLPIMGQRTRIRSLSSIRQDTSPYLYYTLGYPNNEVKYVMLESLEPYFLKEEGGKGPLHIENFCEDLENGDLDSLRDRFISLSLFARLPYGQGEDCLERMKHNHGRNSALMGRRNKSAQRSRSMRGLMDGAFVLSAMAIAAGNFLTQEQNVDGRGSLP